jgi:hypothetical protein
MTTDSGDECGESLLELFETVDVFGGYCGDY